jgi:uroporphyrin-III C-methyltransferase/precorrin-2 dehydrogenase/sirohydrochlorin ferrochelatase
MSRRTLGRILASAIEHGLPAETPALAIVNATRPDQQVVAATAATLGADVAGLAATGPTLVLVGDAVAGAAERGAARTPRSSVRS